jgi:hypothetical protein
MKAPSETYNQGSLEADAMLQLLHAVSAACVSVTEVQCLSASPT